MGLEYMGCVLRYGDLPGNKPLALPIGWAYYINTHPYVYIDTPKPLQLIGSARTVVQDKTVHGTGMNGFGMFLLFQFHGWSGANPYNPRIQRTHQMPMDN